MRPFRKRLASAAMLVSLLLATASCLNGAPEDKKKPKEEKSDPLGSGGRVRGVTTFSPSSTQSSTALFTPGTDAVLALWKTQLTFYATSYHAQAALALTLVPGTIVSNPNLVPLSPLLTFRATDVDGTSLARPDITTELKVDTIIDRKITPEELVALIFLKRGTPEEERYAMPATDLTFTDRGDGSTLVSFTTRDPDFSYAIAASTNGVTPATFALYPNVPPDSTKLITTNADVTDLPVEAGLQWVPAEGSRAAYRLSVAYDGEVPAEGCPDGIVLAKTDVTEVRTTFPVKSSTDKYVAKALEAGKLASFRLCSLNNRTPPDASPGITATYQLPERALAVLSNAPQNPTNRTALAVTVGGELVTDYKYALLTEAAAESATGCADATYSADWIDVATPITDALTEGPQRLCVLGQVGELNAQTPALATALAFAVDQTAPGIFAIDAATTPTNDTTPAFAWAASEGAATYRVAISAEADCAPALQDATQALLTYTSSATLAEGDYFFCVTAIDAATNTTAASNTALPFEIDTTPPVFTSLALANAAADTYVNISEHAASTVLVGTLTASDYALTAYKLTAAATTCDGLLTYGAVPKTDSSDFASDGSYKVCIRLTDLAGNVAYGASASLTLDTLAPDFTSLALANDAADAFVNIVEHTLTTDLVQSLVGVGYDTATYVVAANATTCDAALSYGSLPKANDSGLAVSETSYKVCVKLADTAGNAADYGSSSAFVFDATAPVFTSLDLVNAAADTYLNLAERSLTTALAGSLVASGQAGATYVLQPSAVSCDGSLTYGAMPAANSTAFGADGGYKVCVKLLDTAGNPTYGATATLTLDATVPAFTSLALANAAADGYVNIVDNALTTDVATGISGTGYDTATYALAPIATACSGIGVYGAMPKANDAGFNASESDFKICAKLDDAAGNPAAYGATAALHYDVTAPVFTSLDRQNHAADGYMNVAERLLTSDLAGNLVASGSATADYVVATSGTTCNGALTYGSMPKSNDAGFSSGDTTYKVCVRLRDLAGNPVYGFTSSIELDTSLPTFTSLARANGAADGYLNTAERGGAAANLASTLVGSGYTAVGYKLVTNATTCDVNLTYGAMPQSDNIPDFGADGSYKVCVALSDAAANPVAYGATTTFVLDTQAPSPTNVTSTTPNGAYGAAEVVTVTVTYDEAVVYGGSSGVANLRLETGGTDRDAVYAGGTGTVTLSFDYTVQATDTAADLATHATSPQLSLTGDRTLADAAGNPAGLSVDAATTLASNKNLIIDTTAPSAFTITAPATNDTTPTITWSDPGDAVEYDLKVDDTSGCGTPLQTYSALAVLTQTLTSLADGTYYVCVTARDAADNTANATNHNVAFALTTGSWAAITSTGAPAARTGAGAVWSGTKMIVWGGNGEFTALADGGEYDPVGNSWTAVETTNQPAARTAFVAVWTGSEMFVWGGADGATEYGDGGLYDPAAGAGTRWTDAETVSAPSARRAPAGVWTGTEVLVFGGHDGVGVLGDGGLYDPTGSGTWTALDVTGGSAPAAREQAGVAWTGSTLLVWGGLNGAGTALQGGAIYDPAQPVGSRWTPIATLNAPTARYRHTMIWTGTKLIVFGGTSDGTAGKSDGAIYDPALDSWAALTATDTPTARFDVASAWDGNRMLVFGGEHSGSYRGDGGGYLAASTAWTIPVLQTSGAPTARTSAASVWTGTELLLWSGYGGTYLNDGGRLTPP